ncbi:hypothetical protein DSM104299_00457 [Baekduia alba]|uniref:hypothetical protein n=1 Tax=Baekduia alba TaxID=2997333 RepID=UPI002341CF58|nr:hypothetical protein [Baekduia alba]WCB91780.1 hypothetical protein DSM104299_00457 [Baekduia alba]
MTTLLLGTPDGIVRMQIDGDSGRAAGVLEAPGVTALTVDPNNGELTYAATASGLHRSSDGGRSWKLGGERQVAEVAEALRAVIAQRTDVFYDEVSAPRTFPWTTAFEEDDWTNLRAKARALFGSLSEGKAALIASGSA